MAAQGEKVGSLYVDVGADISKLNEALDAAEGRLNSLSNGNYQFNISQGSTKGGAKDPIQALQKTLNQAQLTVPVSLSLANNALETLKAAILSGMAGFAVPVKVQMTGVAQGTQRIVVDGEEGTVVEQARAPRRAAARTAAAKTAARIPAADVLSPELAALVKEYQGQNKATMAAAGVPRNVITQVRQARAQVRQANAAARTPATSTAAAAPADDAARQQEIKELRARADVLTKALAQSAAEEAAERRQARYVTRQGRLRPDVNPNPEYAYTPPQDVASGKFITKEAWTARFAERIAARARRTMPPPALASRGITAQEMASASGADDSREWDADLGLTGQTLFRMGQGRRPPPSKRLGVRGGLVESLAPRPLHGPRELTEPTEMTGVQFWENVPRGHYGPPKPVGDLQQQIIANRENQARVAAQVTGRPVIRGEAYGATSGAYGAPYSTTTPGTGPGAIRSRLFKVKGEVDTSEETAANLQQRETRARVREAAEKLYDEMERREARGKAPLSERTMINRLVGSGRGRTATGIDREQARAILFPQMEEEAREFHVTRSEAPVTNLQKAQAHLAELRAQRRGRPEYGGGQLPPNLPAPTPRPDPDLIARLTGWGAPQELLNQPNPHIALQMRDVRTTRRDKSNALSSPYSRKPTRWEQDEKARIAQEMYEQETGQVGFNAGQGPAGIVGPTPNRDIDEEIHQQELLVRRLKRRPKARGEAAAEPEAPRLSIEDTIAYNRKLGEAAPGLLKAAEPTTQIDKGGPSEGGPTEGGRGGVQRVFVVNFSELRGMLGASGASKVGSLRVPQGLETEEDVRAFIKGGGVETPATATASRGRAAKRIMYPLGPREDVSFLGTGARSFDPDKPTFGRVRGDASAALTSQASTAANRISTNANRVETGLNKLFSQWEKTGVPTAPPVFKATARQASSFEEQAESLGVRLPRRRPQDESEAALSRADIAGQRATLPERAPSTAFAQIFARATGVKGRFEAALETERGALARQNEAADALQESRAQTGAVKERLAEETNIVGQKRAQGVATKEDYQGVIKLLGLSKDAKDIEGEKTAELNKQNEELAKATKAREKAGGGAASAAQLGALFVGAKAFLVLNQAFDAAMQATGAAIAPVVDYLTGFAETSKKVSASLRDATVASKGNVDASVAATSAQAGLSAATSEFLKVSGLGGNATAQAGAQAGQQTRDLFLATAGGTGGFAPALARGTGGVLNTNLLAEQLGGQAGVGESLARQQGLLLSTAFTQPVSTIQAGNRTVTGVAPGAALELPNPRALALYNKGIDNANDALARQAKFAGLSASSFEVVGKDAKNFDDAAKAMIESGYRISTDFGKVAEQLAKAGTVFEQAGGGNLQGQGFGEALAQLAQGQTIQDPTLLIKEQTRAFNADLQASDLRRQLQTQTLIPGQLGLGLLGHPQLPPGAGIIPRGTNPEELGLKGSDLRELSASLARTGDLQKQLSDRGDAGIQALRVLVGQADDQRRAAYQVPSAGPLSGGRQGPAAPTTPGFAPQLPEFNRLIDQLTAYGKELSNIQQGLADKQARNAILDYNQAITITVRNLNDARALAGQRVQQDKLGIGALERQNVLLQRQSQELAFQSQQLQLQQEQRRINFSVAIAGFQAPGLTSEEREARIEQAKKEAEFAQKQLDIQKQQAALGRKQFKIGVEIQDRSFLRTVQELEFQLNSLERGRKLVIDTAEANQRIAVLEALIAQTQADIGAIVEQASGIAEKLISIGQAIAAAAGGAVRDVVDATVKELTRGVKRYEALANAINHAGQAATLVSTANTGPHAAGALFNTSGATSMVVGEAGTETVAILRNPRTVSASVGGSGGGSVVIQFNGPMNVRSDDDVKAVAREVEKMMNTRGALIGLRNLTR